MDGQERFKLSRTLGDCSEHSPYLILLTSLRLECKNSHGSCRERSRQRMLYPIVSLRRFREEGSGLLAQRKGMLARVSTECLNDEQPDFYLSFWPIDSSFWHLQWMRNGMKCRAKERSARRR